MINAIKTIARERAILDHSAILFESMDASERVMESFNDARTHVYNESVDDIDAATINELIDKMPESDGSDFEEELRRILEIEDDEDIDVDQLMSTLSSDK